MRRRDGRLIWISENARAVHDETGRLICYEGTVEDVTELREYQARIERQARQDDLTGLANRALLRERLQEAVRVAGAGQRPLRAGVRRSGPLQVHQRQPGSPRRRRTAVRDGRAAARMRARRAPPWRASVATSSCCWCRAPTRPPPARSRATSCAPPSETWHFKGSEFRVNGSVGVALYPDHGRDPGHAAQERGCRDVPRQGAGPQHAAVLQRRTAARR